jgi:hypothetical protein
MSENPESGWMGVSHKNEQGSKVVPATVDGFCFRLVLAEVSLFQLFQASSCSTIPFSDIPYN